MKENKKITWIQNLRALACVLIVLLHVIDGWLKPNGIQLEQFSIRWWLDNVIIQICVRVGVPIFIMITGALLLNPEKNLELKKVIKYITRMILILLTFGFAFCLIEGFLTDKLSNPIKTLGESFLHVLENKSWGIMWYIYMLIGLYVLTPALKIILKELDEKNLMFLIGVLFFTSSVIPTLNYTFNINLTDFYLGNAIYIFYYLIGYVIAYKKELIVKATKHYIYIYIYGAIGLIGYMMLLVFKNNFYDYSLINNNNICFIAMWSMFIFYLFSNNTIKIKENKTINIIAKYSFGIYLVHTFWLNIINKGFKIFPDVMPVFIGEFIFWIIAVSLSLISCIILYRLPILKKILK